MATLHSLNFDNRYARLPADLFSRVSPQGFAQPHLVAFNPDVAALLDLDPDCVLDPDLARCFGGAKPLPGAEPLAMKYTGHQFGVYNPDLGDGRGLLLGEVRNSRGEY